MSRSDDRHTDTRYADLADVILALARIINADAHSDTGVVELTATEVNVMRFVDRHPGASPSTVAAATGLQRSNLSRALRDLESKGLIERVADETDGRQVRLVPTALAARNLRRLRGSWSRLLSAAGADDQDLDAALATLRDLELGLTPSAQGEAGVQRP